MQGHNQLDLINDELRLSPYMMNKYVRETISEEQELDYMSKIADFYSRFLVLQYKVNSAKFLSKSVIDLIFTEKDKNFITSLTMSDEDLNKSEVKWS